MNLNCKVVFKCLGCNVVGEATYPAGLDELQLRQVAHGWVPFRGGPEAENRSPMYCEICGLVSPLMVVLVRYWSAQLGAFVPVPLDFPWIQ